MKKVIPYGRQNITQEDIDAVVTTLQSDYLTQGPKIAEFENAFATYVNAKYAVAVSNGTAALHLAVLALGIKEDQYVICTPITFVASVNCVRYCGGNVLFADIDPDTYLMDLKSVKSILENNPDKKIVGIIPVDFAGRVPQLNEFYSVAKEYNLWIIEDACHSPGGYFIDDQSQKQLAGNGVYVDASVFSFHPVKHIATGEGGMITTNDEVLYQKLLNLRTHGITKNSPLYQNSLEFANGNAIDNPTNYPGWYMEMQDLGYNYRITDFQAALGSSQLKKADTGINRRREIADLYTKAFKNSKGIINISGTVEGHAYHLFVLEVNNRRGLYEHLKQQGIYAQIHYIPVHLMPFYKNLGWKEGDFPNSETYYSRCISIPMYATLTDEEVDFIIEQVKLFYQ